MSKSIKYVRPAMVTIRITSSAYSLFGWPVTLVVTLTHSDHVLTIDSLCCLSGNRKRLPPSHSLLPLVGIGVISRAHQLALSNRLLKWSHNLFWHYYWFVPSDRTTGQAISMFLLRPYSFHFHVLWLEITTCALLGYQRRLFCYIYVDHSIVVSLLRWSTTC